MREKFNIVDLMPNKSHAWFFDKIMKFMGGFL